MLTMLTMLWSVHNCKAWHDAVPVPSCRLLVLSGVCGLHGQDGSTLLPGLLQFVLCNSTACLECAWRMLNSYSGKACRAGDFSNKQRNVTSRTVSMRRDKVMGRPHSFYQAAMNYMADNDIQQNMRYEKSHTVGPPPKLAVTRISG